ncbi:hypothetical protein CJP74_06750 [Psittacicella melopsittaci]|uniref:Uncharacterized protein n=1 Tax=Psittacicella melopsittaci TaxID=2028576 RepID=A0A3A1Y053_9GAMM|nr:Ppx/GppA phosphatase family protein [Psittacicella melopsittaci]RIY31692.1 hypothetical protein CJP74_06750 [Psittacicella melopsittaci]
MSTHKKSETKKYIAVIDMGSNSFNLIIARRFGLSRPVIKRFNITVQLARYLNEENILLPEGIARCCKALKSMQEFISHFKDDIEVRANATYTIRSTVNKDQLLAEIAKVFPHKVNILTGEEEARTIFKGIALSNPITDDFIAVDIGGGSTEIILSRNLEPQYLTSKNLGCVSFTQKYFKDGAISKDLFDQAYEAACKIFNTELDNPTVRNYLGCKTAVGSSGTIKNTLLRVKTGLKEVEKRVTALLEKPETEKSIYNRELLVKLAEKVKVFSAKYNGQNYLNAQSLDDLLELILAHQNASQLVYHGFDASGRLVLVGGLAILKALFTVFRFEKLTYSESALREGVLYLDQDSNIFKQIRVLTVHNLRRKFQLENKQFNDFHRQALSIIKQDKYLQQNMSYQDVTNYCVFMLVGISINDDNFTQHSNYILKNTPLYGFNGEQIANIHKFADALVATSHDFAEPMHRLALLMELAYQFTFSSFYKLIKQNLLRVGFNYTDGIIDKLIINVADSVKNDNPYLEENFARLTKVLDKYNLAIEIKSL